MRLRALALNKNPRKFEHFKSARRMVFRFRKNEPIRNPKSEIRNRYMFCPKCGKADQSPETYCRQCGNYLPDFDNPVKKRTTPEEHIKANAVLSFLTAAASLTLSILLFLIFRNQTEVHPIIYVTAGFLLTITAWQIQTFWRTLLLKKHFKKPNRDSENQTVPASLEAKPTSQLLTEADFENHVPASVVEKTTGKLRVKN